MNSQSGRPADTIEIRKYPNRRYYDKTRSRHLTLEQIRALIQKGTNVQIIDSQTGADITSRTLMQMIVEFDAPKLDLFTVPLLVEIIRVNDQVVKGFFEKFFNQALSSFFAFQQQFEKQLREGGVLPSLFPPFLRWQSPASERVPEPAPATKPEAAPHSEAGGLAEKVGSLQRELSALQERLSRRSPRRRKRRQAGSSSASAQKSS
jgi:polyhydroxyalkanoate synthesis repressor PhaR